MIATRHNPLTTPPAALRTLLTERVRHRDDCSVRFKEEPKGQTITTHERLQCRASSVILEDASVPGASLMGGHRSSVEAVREEPTRETLAEEHHGNVHRNRNSLANAR